MFQKPEESKKNSSADKTEKIREIYRFLLSETDYLKEIGKEIDEETERLLKENRVNFIEEAIRQDIARTPNKFVKLSNVTRRLCRTLGVKIVEVKSTNIRNDLKVESDFTGQIKTLLLSSYDETT